MKTLQIAIVILLFCSGAWAENLDASSAEALEKTQKLLRNPVERQEAINKSESAQKTDKMVRKLGSAEDQEKIYELASEIFGTLVKENNGDAIEIQKILSNPPEEFIQKMTPEQRAKLKDIVKGLQVKQPAQESKP